MNSGIREIENLKNRQKEGFNNIVKYILKLYLLKLNK